MSRNGSGTYSAPSGSFNPATNGNSATSSDWNLLLSDISSAMTQSVSADGQTPITGNFNMGNNKLIGLAPGTMPGDSVRYEQVALSADLANNTDPLKGAGLVGYRGRSVRGKLDEHVSVKDSPYNAIGDGITNANTAFLAAAVDGVRYVPPGNFVITNAYIIDDIENYYGEGNLVYNGAILPAGNITKFMQINVPSQFPTLEAAVKFCESKTFEGDGFVKIQIADGTYSIPQIEPKLGEAIDRVEIIGNVANPANVVLNADATNNKCGFLLQRGNGIFKLDGFTLNGVGAWVSAGIWNEQGYGAGIMANYNSSVLIGSKVRVNKFYYGISSRYGSGVRCEPGVVVTQAGDCGFFAFAAALDSQGCQAFDVAHTVEGLGFGFTAEAGGFIDASRSNAAGCAEAGFYANGASMWAHSTTADNNKDGYRAINGGKIEANIEPGSPASNSFNNTRHGYIASGAGAYINANSALATTNGGNGFFAENGGSIDITASDSSNSGGSGYLAFNGSRMYGDSANAFSNDVSGFVASLHSSITGANHDSNSNTGYGYLAQNVSCMQIPNSGGGTNTLGFDSPPVASSPGNNGSYILN